MASRNSSKRSQEEEHEVICLDSDEDETHAKRRHASTSTTPAATTSTAPVITPNTAPVITPNYLSRFLNNDVNALAEAALNHSGNQIQILYDFAARLQAAARQHGAVETLATPSRVEPPVVAPPVANPSGPPADAASASSVPSTAAPSAPAPTVAPPQPSTAMVRFLHHGSKRVAQLTHDVCAALDFKHPRSSDIEKSLARIKKSLQDGAEPWRADPDAKPAFASPILMACSTLNLGAIELMMKFWPEGRLMPTYSRNGKEREVSPLLKVCKLASRGEIGFERGDDLAEAAVLLLAADPECVDVASQPQGCKPLKTLPSTTVYLGLRRAAHLDLTRHRCVPWLATRCPPGSDTSRIATQGHRCTRRPSSVAWRS